MRKCGNDGEMMTVVGATTKALGQTLRSFFSL